MGYGAAAATVSNQARHPGWDGSRERWTVREAAAEPSAPEPVDAEADDTDALEALGEEIVVLAAHLHAGRARFLALVAAFDRRRGWEPGGHRSCAHWLSYRTGYDLRTARDYVRTARRLEALPETTASMQQGRLSYSQVRALTRVATPETEDDLLELAEGCTVSTLERRVRAWRKGSAEDEARREQELHRARRLVVHPDADGGYVLRGRLTPEVGAVVLRALEAASDALYREGTDDGSYEPPASPRQALREASRRRADAMGLVCERALAAGFGGEGDDDGAPVSGTRAERWLAFLHVDADTLAEDTEPGRSELEDGTRLSKATARRLCCDVGAVPVTTDGTVPRNGAARDAVLDVGRKRRTVPPALRRALAVRDRGCRFPACGLRFCDAHHVVHWADGGETSLANTLLLCRRHHRLVHEEGWTVAWWGKHKRAVFSDPRGKVHLDTGWEAPELTADPVERLTQENRQHGVDPDPLTPTATWKRERDVPDPVWFAATEAALAAQEEGLEAAAARTADEAAGKGSR